MSLTSETVMPVVPAGYSGGSGGGFGSNAWGGDGAWWIIILFLFVFCGWGNGNWGGNGNSGGTATQGYDTRSDIQRAFDTQGIDTKLDSITNGMCQQGYQNQQGFHGVDNAVCQLGYQVQQGINSVNTSMLQGFNSTNMGLMQGQNALATQLADCCCTTQRGIDNLNYNIATQACGIQNTMNLNTRDIIDNQNSNSRAILDYLCNDKISTLQTENQALRLAASQSQQNATLIAAMIANTNEVLNRAAPTPVPAYNVPAPYPFSVNPCPHSCG